MPFASPIRGPLGPNANFDVWAPLLRDANVQDGQLRDAHHTVGSVLLLLGAPDVAVERSWGPGARPGCALGACT